MWKPSKDRFIGTAKKQGDVASLARWQQQQQQQKLLACGILCWCPAFWWSHVYLASTINPAFGVGAPHVPPPGAPRLCWQRFLPASRRSPWLPSPVCRIACSHSAQRMAITHNSWNPMALRNIMEYPLSVLHNMVLYTEVKRILEMYKCHDVNLFIYTVVRYIYVV